MAINKAEQQLENQLINRIANLEKELVRLKTSPQPIGADLLKVQNNTTTNIYALAVPAGSSLDVTITTTPNSDFVLTLSSHLLTLYIDGYDTAHSYPNGGSLASGQRKLELYSWIDYKLSDLISPFAIVYVIHVRNNDVTAHDYHIDYSILTPQYTVTSV